MRSSRPALASQSNLDRAVPVLSEPGVVALRSALKAHLRGDIAEADLRRALRLLSDEAHRQHLQAEQLLKIFKQTWVSLPEVQRLPHGPREELLARSITTCIEEFYAERGAC
jgi:hypothetical protein